MTLMLVTTTTDAAFNQVFNRLAVALREPADDTGITIDVYFEALKDLSMEAIELGADALAKEPGRRFFPTTAEWRAAAESAQMARLREAVKPGREEPWQYECGACADTGWEDLFCPGDQTCGRARKHAAHRYVRVCPCRPNNRTYIRHQQFGSGV